MAKIRLLSTEQLPFIQMLIMKVKSQGHSARGKSLYCSKEYSNLDKIDVKLVFDRKQRENCIIVLPWTLH